MLTVFYSRKGFDAPLRRVKFKYSQTGKSLVFLTNNFVLPALTITQLYRLRWRIELFFKWIKQHLRIKAFFGTTENAVTKKWIAISVYVLVAIIKKRLTFRQSSIRTSTDSKSNAIRKSSVNSVSSRFPLCNRLTRISKPTEFIQLNVRTLLIESD